MVNLMYFYLFQAQIDSHVVLNYPILALAAFRTGTLSHAVGTRVDGYTDLPPWTTVPSNASLRVVVVSLCFIPKILFYNSQSMFIPFQTGNK